MNFATFQKAAEYVLTFLVAAILLLLVSPAWLSDGLCWGAAGALAVIFSPSVWAKIYQRWPEYSDWSKLL